MIIGMKDQITLPNNYEEKLFTEKVTIARLKDKGNFLPLEVSEVLLSYFLSFANETF